MLFYSTSGSVFILLGVERSMLLQGKEVLPMTKEQQISYNLKAVANAVAQQALEGLQVPFDVVEEMKRAARGEIKIEEGIRNTVLRFTHGEVRGKRPLP